MRHWSQNFADNFRQRFVREWLLQNAHIPPANAVLLNRVIRIPGHVEDPSSGKLFGESVGEFRPRHPGHDHIRQQQVQSPFMPVGEV